MEQRYAFVLRIWLSDTSVPNSPHASTLRGTLQAVDSTEPLRFTSLRQLNDLLEIALYHSGDSDSTSE